MIYLAISVLLTSLVSCSSSDLNSTQLDLCSQYVNRSKLMELDSPVRTRICSELASTVSDNSEVTETARSRPAPYEVWGYGLLMVTLIRFVIRPW